MLRENLAHAGMDSAEEHQRLAVLLQQRGAGVGRCFRAKRSLLCESDAIQSKVVRYVEHALEQRRVVRDGGVALLLQGLDAPVHFSEATRQPRRRLGPHVHIRRGNHRPQPRPLFVHLLRHGCLFFLAT